MKNITEQFKEFRSTTPKHIQWILLGAAILVVVILLFLLIGHKSNHNEKLANINQPVSFKISPQTITFSDVVVGKSANENIKIHVNMPVVIDKFDIFDKQITQKNNCQDLTSSCLVNIVYKPTHAVVESHTKMILTWHVVNQEDISNTDTLEIIYSAKEAEKKVEPVVAPKPQPEPEFEDEEDIFEPEPVIEKDPIAVSKPVETVAKDIEKIAPVDVFAETEPVDDFVLPPEKCSDFAIPGYNQSGVQIGWIKPERGANYFHPFSDKDCSNPTGKYDFATGIITSLKDGSKIGTDAEHIGYRNVRSRNLSMPKLSSRKSASQNGTFDEEPIWSSGVEPITPLKMKGFDAAPDYEALMGSASDAEAVVSSRPYDRTFILRQFKPIPATIVSEVRADPSVYGCKGNDCSGENYSIPVRATVDRNVFSDDGRTIIIPTGTLLMGYLSGELPGPYQSVGRMNIKWYQFIRPDGVEFNFGGENQDPYSADAQGRVGVPGHGSTDYVEQMVMPILTSIVPAAVNMIAPIADTIVNQINLDNNTIVQSGTIRSSEMAKQEIINTWNKVAQKLLVDALDNTTPPFSIAAGTRINVFSPVDLIVTCGTEGNDGKKCAFTQYNDQKRREWSKLKRNVTVDKTSPSWVGQVRSFNLIQYCTEPDKNGKITIGNNWAQSGYDYRTVYMYCESQNYEAKNNAKQQAYYESQKQKFEDTYGDSDRQGEQLQKYNQEVLGLKYDDDGYIENPFKSASSALEEEDEVLTCLDGSEPDMYGCCTGETYTDMGDAGFNCCPDDGGDCFPPIEK